MSRNKNNKKIKKKQSKAQQQRIRRQRLAARRSGAPSAHEVCEKAIELLDRRCHDEAREILEEYEATSPGRRDVLQLLLEVYHQQHDFGPYRDICRRLVRMEPGNPMFRLMLAGGFAANAQLASALVAFRHFVDRWPNDPLADGARQSIARLEPAVAELLQEFSLTGKGGLETMVLNEEMLGCLATGDYRGTIQAGEKLLSLNPNFVPALNNLSEAYFRTGQLDAAIGVSRRILREQPENIHALSNLSRFLYITGQHEEAQELLEQLLAVPSTRADQYSKKCEALGYFGADEEIYALYREAKRNRALRHGTPGVALLYHFAATAMGRLGYRRRAVGCWRKALSIDPTLDLARSNLEDASGPARERNGPWYFSLDYFFDPDSLNDLFDVVQGLKDRRDDQTFMEAFKHFADAHPEIVRLIPALLDRGDSMGRSFAWSLAAALDTPEMRQALRDFCSSGRGPERLRLETAHILADDE
jgi:tetratricopeptide (TPR) repeat protein